jgi:hypothetical protein
VALASAEVGRRLTESEFDMPGRADRGRFGRSRRGRGSRLILFGRDRGRAKALGGAAAEQVVPAKDEAQLAKTPR